MFLRRCEVIVPAVPVLHLLGGVLEAGITSSLILSNFSVSIL